MAKLTKTSLIKGVYSALIAEKELHLTKGEVERVINRAFDMMKEQLITQEQVLISGFFRMETALSKGRTYRNPSDPSKKVVKADRIVPRCSMSKVFREAVSEANPVNNTRSRRR